MTEERKHKTRILGLESKEYILPGQKEDVVTRPQLVFKGDRIHIPLEVAQHFDILDIRVGYNSQFISAEAVPADTFSLKVGKDSIERNGEAFDFDMAQVAQDIKFVVRNKSNCGVKFKAAVIGKEYY